MIAFPTVQWKYFNHVLHNLIESFIIETYEELDDFIETTDPKYLWREQRDRYLQVINELYYWSDLEDGFIHEMTAFHELVLYRILQALCDIQNDYPEFLKHFFDAEALSLLLPENFEEEIEGSYEQYYSDLSNFEFELFEDTDFLFVEDLINYRRIGINSFEEVLEINIDYFFEILPNDIRKRYQTGHITLSSEISSFIDYLKDRIECASLYHLFWKSGHPILENQIQIIIENILDAYFHNKKVDLSREVFLGNGKVDFKLFRSHEPEEKY